MAQQADLVSPAILSAHQAPVPSQKPTSGRARGKSISISAAALQSSPRDRQTVAATSRVPEERSDSIRTENVTPVPLSQPHTLPRSPVSPHRAKPRRGVCDDLSSDASEPCSAGLPTTPDRTLDHHLCDARAHADRGLHFHPSPEAADDVGAEDYSSDLASSKAGSDTGHVETESATGSLRTEAGSSAPPDTSSEGSNSDVEIYLEGHGLDDSAMRLNCLGNTSFASKSVLLCSFFHDIWSYSIPDRYYSEANCSRSTSCIPQYWCWRYITHFGHLSVCELTYDIPPQHQTIRIGKSKPNATIVKDGSPANMPRKCRVPKVHSTPARIGIKRPSHPPAKAEARLGFQRKDKAGSRVQTQYLMLMTR